MHCFWFQLWTRVTLKFLRFDLGTSDRYCKKWVGFTQGHSPPKKNKKIRFNHSTIHQNPKKNHHPNFGSNRSDLMQLQFLSSNSLRCSDLCYGGEFAICRTHKETIELGSFVSFLKTLDGRMAEGCMYV